MKVALILKVANHKLELYYGKGEAKWELLQVSATILTVGIEFSIKVYR